MFNKKNQGTINQLEILHRPKSIISEQIRTLRTNILFTPSDVKIKRLLITSSEQGEGKSTVSANLAVSFAQAGYKTLLIDTDLRRPSQHRIMEVPNVKGLSNILAGQISEKEALVETPVSSLHFIPSGPIPPNPAELLGSATMAQTLSLLEGMYDMIILDAPPVLAVADAQILSDKVDGTLLVVNSRKAHKEKVIEANEQLKKSAAKTLGVVLNDIDKKEAGNYYYYYGETK